MNRNQRRAQSKIQAKNEKADPLKLASELAQQALQCFQQGQYLEADSLFRSRLAIQEKQLGADHPEIARSLSDLAALLNTLGNYSEAVPLYRRSLTILENQLGVDHLDVAACLYNFATLLMTIGNYSESESLIRRGLAIREKHLGSSHSYVADDLNNLANLLNTLGNFSDAEALYRRSLAIREKQLGPDHPDTAESLNNLASLLDELGDFSDAEALYRRSLAICEKQLGPDHPDTARSLNNLASFLNGLGKFSDAEPLFRRSLAIWEKQLGADHPYIAYSLNGIAGCLNYSKKSTETEPLYRKCLTILEKQFGPDHPDVAKILSNIAAHLMERGNCSEAEPLFRRCLAIQKKMLAPVHPDVAGSLHNYSLLFKNLGHNVTAILFAKQAVNILQNTRLKIAGTEGINLSTFDTTIEHYYSNLSELLIKSARYGEAEYVMGMLKEKERFELLRRDRVIDRLKLSISYNNAEEPLIEQFDTLGASLYALGQRQDTLKKVKEPTSTQKKELADIKQRLEDVSHEFNLFLDSLHDVLPPREVRQIRIDSNGLIDLTNAATGTAAITTVTAEDTFCTILATPYGRSGFSSEYPAEELSNKILRFRELLKEIENNDYLPIAQELYNIIIRPMEQEFQSGDITTLYWMLNGALRRLPLAALHDGKQFLLEKYRTINITTPGKIGIIPHEQWNGLGMGVTKAHSDFKALPSVKEELENIIARESTNGVIPGDILLDEQFTREAMEEHLETGGYKAVHIASHFYLNPVNETLSYLLLGDGSKISIDELSCKHRIFKGVDLVAFSACSTALGTASTRGREVDSIGNMAEEQGAKSVLATLWDVEDKSTSMVMREFYRLREGGMTKAEALQQAQLALLKKKDGFVSEKPELDFSHPYFWAPFILIGNGG